MRVGLRKAGWFGKLVKIEGVRGEESKMSSLHVSVRGTVRKHLSRSLGYHGSHVRRFASHVQYTPKQHGTEFVMHPNQVMETDTLASVSSPIVNYCHSLHKQTSEKTLSSIQTETIVLACARVSYVHAPILWQRLFAKHGFFLRSMRKFYQMVAELAFWSVMEQVKMHICIYPFPPNCVPQGMVLGFLETSLYPLHYISPRDAGSWLFCHAAVRDS
jgi:hypothetical protein